jgi:hypothetical protein
VGDTALFAIRFSNRTILMEKRGEQMEKKSNLEINGCLFQFIMCGFVYPAIVMFLTIWAYWGMWMFIGWFFKTIAEILGGSY